MYIKEYYFTLVQDSSQQNMNDSMVVDMMASIAVEASIDLFVNDTKVATILATPENLLELGTGYLVSEGLLRDMDDLLELHSDSGSIHARMRMSDDLEIWHELRSSGCVGVKWDENEDIHVISDAIFDMCHIQNSLRYLSSDVYSKSRGTHSACIINTDGECITKAIDIGRHNAFDKAIGAALMGGIDMSKHFILSSGRQSAGMVMKAARVGIPLIVTKTAPLNTGIDAARNTGICLVCYTTDASASIFSNVNRIAFLDGQKSIN